MRALSRIVLRHISYILVLIGVLNAEDVYIFLEDPTLILYTEIALGAGLGFLVELWYAFRKKLGEKD